MVPALDLQHWSTDISTLHGRALVGITSANVQINNVTEDGYIYFNTRKSGVGVSSERVRITGIGSVGIGITTPQAQLHVAGTIHQTGIEYPTIRPTLDLNFAATKTLDRRITFTRDSIGTYTDELGIVRTAPNNTPRFDYDPVTRESLGLLIEEARTNLSYYSQDFTNNSSSTAWRTGSGYSRATLVSNTGIDDPSGGSTASRWSSGTTNSTELIYHILPTALTVGTTYTASIWVRRVTQTGPVDLILGDNVAISVTSQLDAVPFGQWVRVSGSRTVTGSSAVRENYVSVKPNGSSPTTIDIWGYQAEEGSFATSYIPTSNATVTRAADYAKITGTNFTDFYNYTESAVSVRFNMYGYTGSGFNRVYEISDGTANNRHSLLNLGTNAEIYETFVVDGSNEIGTEGEAITFGNFYNYTEAFKKDDYQRYLNLNGTLEGHTDSSIAINNFSPTQIMFGGPHVNSSSAGILNGHILHFKYYNKRLPNAQLQGLTHQ